MMPYKILPMVFLLISNNISATPDNPDIKAGLWEIGILMEIPDMPGQTPRIAQKECITAENLLPKLQQQTGECTITASNIIGNTATWSMSCPIEGGVILGDGELHYQSEVFEGTVTLQLQGHQAILPMTSKLDGHYLGPCTQ